jgi:hypothetical protein
MIATTTTTNLQHIIEIEKPTKPNKITALVTFDKGGKVKGMFTFEFTPNNCSIGGKKKERISYSTSRS